VESESESPLGAFIRQQRELQALSVRRLAELAGISNPYLSQIERGLREPSEQVLEALAEQLELSAETLRAHDARSRDGMDDTAEPAVVTAIREDPALTARQRRALLEVYEAFTSSDRRRRGR
jgi:transcriptional regulator with XRE-family HTH domain